MYGVEMMNGYLFYRNLSEYILCWINIKLLCLLNLVKRSILKMYSVLSIILIFIFMDIVNKLMEMLLIVLI